MSLHIIRQDIKKVKADAIVNTANPHPEVGRGTDGAVYEAALRIGIDAISTWLMHHEMEVYLTVFSENAYSLAGMIFEDITSYIDGNAAVHLLAKEYDHFCEKASSFQRSAASRATSHRKTRPLPCRSAWSSTCRR